MRQCNAFRTDGVRCRGHARPSFDGGPAEGLCGLHHHYLQTARQVRLRDGSVVEPFLARLPDLPVPRG